MYHADENIIISDDDVGYDMGPKTLMKVDLGAKYMSLEENLAEELEIGFSLYKLKINHHYPLTKCDCTKYVLIIIKNDEDIFLLIDFAVDVRNGQCQRLFISKNSIVERGSISSVNIPSIPSYRPLRLIAGNAQRPSPGLNCSQDYSNSGFLPIFPPSMRAFSSQAAAMSFGRKSLFSIGKTEVNFRRLLASAPRQQNQAKLAHYVATLREQLEQLAEEKTHEGSLRVPKAMLNEYSEKIETIAANLVSPSEPDEQECEDPSFTNSFQDSPKAAEGYHSPTLGLRKRLMPASISHDRTHNTADGDKSGSVHLDDAAHAHLDKHRKLQENLTDEMVGLARQLKERSLIMSQSLQNTERILDSTESAVEQSLASTNRANVRATEIYSETSKTTCFTWLILFAMTCVFIMVVLLIRVT